MDFTRRGDYLLPIEYAFRGRPSSRSRTRRVVIRSASPRRHHHHDSHTPYHTAHSHQHQEIRISHPAEISSPSPIYDTLVSAHCPDDALVTSTAAAAVGDDIVRKLVPRLEYDSGRPVALLMNYGNLVMQEDLAAKMSGQTNAVMYNGPGATLSLLPSDGGSDYFSPVSSRRFGGTGIQFSVCPGCGSQRVLFNGGLCRDCSYSRSHYVPAPETRRIGYY